MRLNRYLSQAGVASRRKADELIAAEKVTVNGRPAQLGMSVDKKDEIRVSGKKIEPRIKAIYVLLDKPRGVVSTVSDERNRPTVLELVPHTWGRLFPVGRLDMESEGLLLLTNDGDLAQKLTHPSQHIAKTYEVWVRGRVTQDHVRQLKEGIVLKEEVARLEQVEILERRGKQTGLKIILTEGKNRQLRRMLGKLDLPVERLVRTGIGGLTLNDLGGSVWRELDEAEVRKMMRYNLKERIDE